MELKFPEEDEHVSCRPCYKEMGTMSIPPALSMGSEFWPGAQDQRRLGTKVDVVYSLLGMLECTETREDMSATLLSMSSSTESCLAMRQSGCLPLLIQLIHSPGQDQDTIDRASQALHNIVHARSDERAGRREVRVLKLLEQLRAYCQKIRTSLALGQQSEDLDRHPGPAIAALMKLSFDEAHRHAICQLGGLHAVAELIETDHSSHGSECDDQNCITVRRYAGMALTNLTFGDGKNKALLCSFRKFMKALVSQLHSPSDDLRQVTASVLRNLSWRADANSKQTLREVGAVTGLTKAAMEGRKEPTLKSILSALWNLSAHCSINKVNICAVEGALAFLVDMLSYKAPSKTMAIVENAGGILRNVSSHIAVREDYRCILRERGCLQVLLQQLRSPSLTVVSNACGTLWNLSARCPQDQRLLWDLGAVPMLRSLVHSKHKMISMGSSATLKNLLGAKPGSSNLIHLDSTARKLGLPTLPVLVARRQKALEQEIDQNLAETCDNIEPSISPTNKDEKFSFHVDTNFSEIGKPVRSSHVFCHQFGFPVGSYKTDCKAEKKEVLRGIHSPQSDALLKRMNLDALHRAAPTDIRSRDPFTSKFNSSTFGRPKDTHAQDKYGFLNANAAPLHTKSLETSCVNEPGSRGSSSWYSEDSAFSHIQYNSQTPAFEDNYTAVAPKSDMGFNFFKQPKASSGEKSDMQKLIGKSAFEGKSNNLASRKSTLLYKEATSQSKMYGDKSPHQETLLNDVQKTLASCQMLKPQRDPLEQYQMESHLDEPTDYSLRYAEHASDEDEKHDNAYLADNESGNKSDEPANYSLRYSERVSDDDEKLDTAYLIEDKSDDLKYSLRYANDTSDDDEQNLRSRVYLREKKTKSTYGGETEKDKRKTHSVEDKEVDERSTSYVSQDASLENIQKRETFGNLSLDDLQTEQASDGEEGNENLLADCISIGIQNNRNKQLFGKNTPDKQKAEKSPISHEPLNEAEHSSGDLKSDNDLRALRLHDSTSFAEEDVTFLHADDLVKDPLAEGGSRSLVRIQECRSTLGTSNTSISETSTSSAEALEQAIRISALCEHAITHSADKTEISIDATLKTTVCENLEPSLALDRPNLSATLSITDSHTLPLSPHPVITESEKTLVKTITSMIPLNQSQRVGKNEGNDSRDSGSGRIDRTTSTLVPTSTERSIQPTSGCVETYDSETLETSRVFGSPAGFLNTSSVDNTLALFALKEEPSSRIEGIISDDSGLGFNESIKQTKECTELRDPKLEVRSPSNSTTTLVMPLVTTKETESTNEFEESNVWKSEFLNNYDIVKRTIQENTPTLFSKEKERSSRSDLVDRSASATISEDCGPSSTTDSMFTALRKSRINGHPEETTGCTGQREFSATISCSDHSTTTLVIPSDSTKEQDSTSATKRSAVSDIWNDDSQNDVSFPSISVSAPLIASFESDVIDGRALPKYHEGMNPTHTKFLDRGPSGLLTDSAMFSIMGVNGVDITDNRMNSLETINSQDRSEASSITPTYNEGVLNPGGEVHSRSLENLLGNYNISMHSQLENIKPPSLMDEMLDADMGNSIMSVSSISSDIVDAKEKESHSLVDGDLARTVVHSIFSIARSHYIDSMHSSANNHLSETLENIKPPSLFNEVSQMDGFTTEVITDNLSSDSEAEIQNEEAPHANDLVHDPEDEPEATVAVDPVRSSSLENGLDSPEDTSERSLGKSQLTPKEKRLLSKERYKTYTIDTEMPDNKEKHEENEVAKYRRKSSPFKSLTPKQRRQEDRARFQTQVLKNTFPALVVRKNESSDDNQAACDERNEESADSPVFKSVIPIPKKSPVGKPIRKRHNSRKDHQERYRTRTLSRAESSLSNGSIDRSSSLDEKQDDSKEMKKMSDDEVFTVETPSKMNEDPEVVEDETRQDSGTVTKVYNDKSTSKLKKMYCAFGRSKSMTGTANVRHLAERYTSSKSEEKIENCEAELEKEQRTQDWPKKTGPRIVKAGSISKGVTNDSSSEKIEPETVKVVRGRRKPLYSKPNMPKKAAPSFSSKQVSPAVSTIPVGRANAAPAVKLSRLTTAKQHGTSLTSTQRIVPKPKTALKTGSATKVNEKRGQSVSAPAPVKSFIPRKRSAPPSIKSNPSQNPAESIQSEETTTVAPIVAPLKREGTFTKDEPENENVPAILPLEPEAKVLDDLSDIHQAATIRVHSVSPLKLQRSSSADKDQSKEVSPHKSEQQVSPNAISTTGPRGRYPPKKFQKKIDKPKEHQAGKGHQAGKEHQVRPDNQSSPGTCANEMDELPALAMRRSSTFEMLLKSAEQETKLDSERPADNTEVEVKQAKSYRNSCDFTGIQGSPCKIPVKQAGEASRGPRDLSQTGIPTKGLQNAKIPKESLGLVAKRSSQPGSLFRADSFRADGFLQTQIVTGNIRAPAAAIVSPFNYNPKDATKPALLKVDTQMKNADLGELQAKKATASRRVTSV
ncbi:uncharacterized protein LOC105702713 isoform X2 [Orussus abietinus]|uniref:uncharacterized protein LOC105702713 isoform X2 n=1 Tax=Orussus abietinus TaxID=222816 RepID=UPI0006262878|nr:uncharacterized protein LOC105702713 isoform X2 [Orussus abietinus]